MPLRKRDLRRVRREAILCGAMRPSDVDPDERIEALREEVLALRARIASLENEDVEPHKPALVANR